MKNILVLILLTFTFTLQAQNILWETSLPGLNNYSYIQGVALHDSLGILALGTTNVNGEPLEWLRFDTTGQFINRRLILNDKYPNNALGKGMLNVPGEDNYIVYGFGIDTINFKRDFIAKIDAYGNRIWEYDTTYLGFYQSTQSAIIMRDKSVVATGYVQQAGTDWDLSIKRIDSLGQLMWENNIPLPGNQEGMDITEMMDGSLVISGSNGNNNMVNRVDFAGNLIMDTTYLNNYGEVRLNAVCPDYFNRIMLTTYSINNFNDFNGELMRISPEMEIEWSRQESPGSWVLNLNNDSNIIRLEYTSNPFIAGYSSYTGSSRNWIKSYPNDGNHRGINIMTFMNNDKMLISGSKDIGSQSQYWLSAVDGVGEEWVPDRCAFSPPVAGFDQSFTANGLFTFRDTSYAGLKYLDTVYTWAWSSSIGQSSTDSTFTMLIDTTSTTSLDVELVISNWYGCTDTLSKSFTFQTGVGLVENIKRSIEVWPNPARDVLNIRLSHFNTRQDFRLYDVQGREQLRTTITGNEAQIPIGKLPSGLYFYQLSGEGRVERGKVVKE